MTQDTISTPAADGPQRAFYIDMFSDEVVPCEPTLEAWALWLSTAAEDWGRPDPAAEGETFQASVLRFEPDIIAIRSRGLWSLSRQPEHADFLAVRWGQGLGWSPDNIVWGEDMGAALIAWLNENDDACDDEGFVAVGINEPSVMLRYRSGPPANLQIEGVVQ